MEPQVWILAYHTENGTVIETYTDVKMAYSNHVKAREVDPTAKLKGYPDEDDAIDLGIDWSKEIPF